MVKFTNQEIEILSQVICGDQDFQNSTGINFFYRSGTQLNQFFLGLGLGPRFDGGTRRIYVKAVIDNLNSEESEIKGEISRKMWELFKAVIRSNQFKPQVIEYVNIHVLNPHGMLVAFENGKLLIKALEGNITYRDVSITPRPPYKDDIFTFVPNFFKKPAEKPKDDLISIMMPFDESYDEINEKIKQAIQECEMVAERADDLWDDSVLVQDIFSLIYQSRIVICVLTGHNPNVFYECGIAHTLGKEVIPIAQKDTKLPFDIHHHRALIYDADDLEDLKNKLVSRINHLLDKGSSN